MTRRTTLHASKLPIGRTLLALGVLSGTLYWANCSFNPGVAPVLSNGFFAGCYEGEAGGDKATLVLTAPGPGDSETLTGCLALRGASLAAVLVGDVDDQTREEAALSVTVPATGAMFELRAVRAPAGNVDATSIRLSDAGGAPPELAATGDLLRCAVPVTCADLGLSMPFAPENP